MVEEIPSESSDDDYSDDKWSPEKETSSDSNAEGAENAVLAK